jgi:hypothetical protein
MGWSFPGVVTEVEADYTQTLGFQPDAAILRILQQGTNIPNQGTLTFTWGLDTLTLPNCVVDLASVRVQGQGKHVILRVWDRRERWKNAAPISGEYNVLRVGNRLREKNLRELGTILLNALGETSADVSALPTTEYPFVSWECESVTEVAESLFREYGYSIALGFGSEVVTVVKLGTGASLPTTGIFVGSDTFDPKLVPRYVRSCFEPSVAQARLKLEPVGIEPSTQTWEHIDDLSYKPAGGWEVVAPLSMPDVVTEADYLYYTGYVRRAYRVMGFADETWDLPDGSGVVAGLEDILPLFNRLLETEVIRVDEAYAPFRVYGKLQQEERQHGNPVEPIIYTTGVCDEVIGRSIEFDGENGVIIFREPAFYVDSGYYLPADLWLECTFRVRNQTNFAWMHYEKDVEVEPSGLGYVTIKQRQRAETIVEYDCSEPHPHQTTGFSTNQAALDAIAASTAAAVAGTYADAASEHRIYNEPKLSLRCDGAIVQVRHIMTEGEREHPVNRTIASRFVEADRGVFTRDERNAHVQALSLHGKHSRSRWSSSRWGDAND